MKLIVGLGNPGDKYTATRHNAGFWFVERLAVQSGTVLRKEGKFQALVGRHGASGAWLVLPQSFMNSSGRPVHMMASFFRIEPADILVIHDELDLPPGIVRLKQGGGVAGHNGLKDISARLGTHDYWRLRLGIGRAPDRGATVDYVLHKPSQEERTAIDDAIARALEVLPLLLGGDAQGAMLKLHTQEPEQKPQAAAAREEKPARPDATAKAAPVPEAPARSEGAVADTAAETPPPVRRASSIERFADIAQSAPAKPAAAPGRIETAAPAADIPKARAAGQAGTGPVETDRQAEKPAATGKKGALNSLLKKFLPDGGSGRKK